MGTQLSLRIALPMALVVCLTLGLSAFLSYGKFQRTLVEIEQSRLSFILQDLHRVFENNLNLGVSLQGLQTSNTILARALERSPQLRSAYLFDTTGSILSSAGQSLEKAPPTWLGLLKTNSRDQKFFTSTNDQAAVVITLFDPLGQSVGGLALMYSITPRLTLLSNMSELLIRGSASSAGLAILATIIGLGVVVRITRARLDALAKVLEDNRLSASEEKAESEDLLRVRESSYETLEALTEQRQRLTTESAPCTAQQERP